MKVIMSWGFVLCTLCHSVLNTVGMFPCKSMEPNFQNWVSLCIDTCSPAEVIIKMSGEYILIQCLDCSLNFFFFIFYKNGLKGNWNLIQLNEWNNICAVVNYLQPYIKHFLMYIKNFLVLHYISFSSLTCLLLKTCTKWKTCFNVCLPVSYSTAYTQQLIPKTI